VDWTELTYTVRAALEVAHVHRQEPLAHLDSYQNIVYTCSLATRKTLANVKAVVYSAFLSSEIPATGRLSGRG
jgi:hypothetical protein